MKHLFTFLTIICWVGIMHIQAQQIGMETTERLVKSDTLITQISLISAPTHFGPFYVVGSELYLDQEDKINIYDISNPTSPSSTGSIQLECCVEDLYATPGRVYVTGPQNDMVILDVNDPSNPVELGRLDIDVAAESLGNIIVEGNYAYVACDSDGIRIIDVSNPSNPIEVEVYNTPGVAKGVAYMDNHLCVADGNSGLRIINVSDPANPVETGFTSLSGLALWVYASGNYAYVACGNQGMRIIDVSDPTNPVEVGSLNKGNTFRLGGYGNFVYMSVANKIYMVDVTDPSQPTDTGLFSTASGTNGTIMKIYAVNQFIYASDQNMGFYILQNDVMSDYDEHFISDLPEYSIFPNPAKHFIKVQFKSKNQNNSIAAIYDVNGRKIMEQHIPSGKETIEIDISSLESGVYFCRVTIKEKSVTKEIIKQ